MIFIQTNCIVYIALKVQMYTIHNRNTVGTLMQNK